MKVKIQEVINYYDLLVKNIDYDAHKELERAYGGVIRSSKGSLVENIARKIIKIAWEEIGGNQDRLSEKQKQIKIPIKEEYLSKIKCEKIKEYIENNIDDYFYNLKTDVHTYIDNKFIIGTECKAYTENSMLKRILVDFTLLSSVLYKDSKLNCVLLQLESQLGGDYSNISKDIIIGSPSTHTLLSYFDVDLHIITLLDGERYVKKPIHKKEHFKELKENNILKAIEVYKQILKPYA